MSMIYTKGQMATLSWKNMVKLYDKLWVNEHNKKKRRLQWNMVKSTRKYGRGHEHTNNDWSGTWLKVQEDAGDVMNTQTTTEVEYG